MSAPNVLMIGTGEYTTGYVHGKASRSDKSAGVVALTLFDLRQRGLVGQLFMAGTQGTKFPGIRSHLNEVVGKRYLGMDTSFTSYPADDVERDPEAYVDALGKLSPGDIVIIFTPDDTHYRMAMRALDRECHVLVAKPIVQTLDDHLDLIQAARIKNTLMAMEVHKRWDPIYLDARDRIRKLGEFSFFSSYMSQPKSQLATFKAWAGKSSDISYYLNAHHVDFNVWAVGGMARPIEVTALAATGVARREGIETEDTITLATQWLNQDSKNLATALYTASWIAPRSDVHSQQRFFYMGQKGECQVDQAHRGYGLATDQSGFGSPNPLFMKYEPDEDGRFVGQQGYGYRSIEAFVRAVCSIRSGNSKPEDWNGKLATIHDTARVTAILEAGRRSLDADNATMGIRYDSEGVPFAVGKAG